MDGYDKQNIRLPQEVIGTSVNYYQKLDNEHPGGLFTSWNWMAFLFTTYWLVYRRCYKYAILSWIGAGIFSSIVTAIFAIFEIPAPSMLLSLVVYIFYGLFGNCMYINGIKDKIYNLQAKGLSDTEIIDKTTPSWTPVGIMIAIPFILTIVIFAIVFITIFAGASMGSI